MIDIFVIAAWAAAILSIAGVIGLIIKPVLNSFTKITKNLTEITYSLQMINREIEDSKGDRTGIRNELKDHDKRLDEHEILLTRHGEQLTSLWKSTGNKKEE